MLMPFLFTGSRYRYRVVPVGACPDPPARLRTGPHLLALLPGSGVPGRKLVSAAPVAQTSTYADDDLASVILLPVEGFEVFANAIEKVGLPTLFGK